MKASLILTAASLTAAVAVGAPSALAAHRANGLYYSNKLRARTTHVTRTAGYTSLASQGLYQVAVHTILAG
jgi:hypothetical protein